MRSCLEVSTREEGRNARQAGWGTQYFSPDTVDRLQQLLDHATSAESAPKTIEVPAYPFS